MNRGRTLGAVLLAGVAAAACSAAPRARGRADALAEIVAQADRSGAKRCAPRELALAESELRFARVDLDQGQLGAAEAHLAKAEPNARAALAHSPSEKCQTDGPSLVRPGDRDGDGFPDEQDKCPDEPETWNTLQDDDGCPDDPDTDGDRIADSVDSCPTLPEDFDGYLDDDGCPDPDNDADGVADAADKCPDKSEDLDGWEDEDGCPDPDNDRDQLVDLEDQCPNQAGPPVGARPGCPAKAVPVVVTAREIRITQQIQFEFNRAIIKKESFVVLDAVRDVLRAYPKMTIEVQGHTDNVGNAGYNLKLSQQRADAVRTYLVARAGVEAGRLTAKGYGQTQPLLPNTSDANRALNRRVQFIRTESAAKP